MVAKHTPLVKLTIQEIVAALDATPSGSGWTARCPAHEDRSPSLSIGTAKNGKALLHCHAGCTYADIRAAILTTTGKEPASKPLSPSKSKPPVFDTLKDALAALDQHMLRKANGHRVANWTYRDLDGSRVAVVVRYDLPTTEEEKQSKTFRPIAKHPDGWRWCDPPGLWPLYNLTQLELATRVYDTEGEKAADALSAIGLIAVTSAHGAKSPKKTEWSSLAGKHVVLLPDNDKAGQGYAQAVATLLSSLEPRPTIKILNLDWPGRKESDDVIEWIAHHRKEKCDDEHLRERIDQMTREATAWVSGLTLTTEQVGSKQRITARRDDTIIHVDEFSIANANRRDDFRRALLKKLPDLAPEAVDTELLQLAEQIAETPVATSPTEPVELELFNICRPEQFFSQDVSGLTVAVPCLMNGKPAARYLQALRWGDGRREVRPIAETIDLLDGQKLFLHPTPNEPNIETAKGTWSASSREEWLTGNNTADVAKLFHHIVGAIKHFVSLPPDRGDGTYATLALWVMMTYVYRAWETIPYLYAGGALNSGKTHLFDVLNLLVFRPLPTQNMTAPLLFRSLHDRGGTLLLDEAERLRSNTPDQQELCSMLLAGYHRGGQAMRLEPHGDSFRPVAFDVYGPKALACIAGLPSPLASRCITILMFRASKDSEKPRRDLDTYSERWQSIRDRLHIITLEHGPNWLELARRKDVLPNGFSNRDAQLWQPLLALASFID
jgi:hypothetical protein